MPIALLSARSKVFDQADPRRVSDYVNQHVGNHQIALEAPGNRAMLSHRRLAELDLCHISYGGVTQVTSRSLHDRYHLQIMLSGHCIQRLGNRQRVLGAGDLLIINPCEPVDLTYSADCEKFILKIPVEVMIATCDTQRWSPPSEGLRFDNQVYRLMEMQAVAQLLSLICQEVELQDSLRTVQDHYVQIVTRKLLTDLASNLTRSGTDSQTAALCRLNRYIDEHLKEDLHPEDLAAIAHMSLRSVYLLFQQHVGETPRRYILGRKLEEVQAALLDPGCHVRSITELALEFGFSHLGRFASRYKARFAELPSQTLARRAAT